MLSGDRVLPAKALGRSMLRPRAALSQTSNTGSRHIALSEDEYAPHKIPFSQVLPENTLI
jgi:hypothetical protein